MTPFTQAENFLWIECINGSRVDQCECNFWHTSDSDLQKTKDWQNTATMFLAHVIHHPAIQMNDWKSNNQNVVYYILQIGTWYLVLLIVCGELVCLFMLACCRKCTGTSQWHLWIWKIIFPNDVTLTSNFIFENIASYFKLYITCNQHKARISNVFYQLPTIVLKRFRCIIAHKAPTSHLIQVTMVPSSMSWPNGKMERSPAPINDCYRQSCHLLPYAS